MSQYELDGMLRELNGNPRKPRTGRKDYHKDPKRKHGKPGKVLSKWDRRRIIAWDGEGRTLEDGTHIYNMLSNSRGDILLRHEGIGTEEALEFFLDHNDTKAINVIFGGSYDVNMILGDLGQPDIERLWEDGKVRWKGYEIGWASRKRFRIRRLKRNPMTGKSQTYGDSFMLWDVLGFFQTNFVNSCRKWLGDAPMLDDIARMKAQRSEFREEDLQEILAYNQSENNLLVLLMQALFNSFDTCGIRLERYDGAGAVAGALLKRAGIPEHKGEWDAHLNWQAQRAYGGGRIEAIKIGNQEEGPIYRYDINSAYPSVAVNLPSFKDGTYTSSSTWDGSDTSIVHVFFSLDGLRKDGTPRPSYPFYPCWVRDMDGSIYYPPSGTGCYWGSEVRALSEFYEEGEDYWILRSYNLQLPHGDVRPFNFIADAYRHRAIFKKQGNMAHEALKLGLNSIYGKLAQQAGARNGRLPTYHQLMWAGMITAGCRSQLYRAAMQKPWSVIAFATDAVITTEPLDLPGGDKMGEWTPEVFDGITIVQPGVYWLKPMPGQEEVVGEELEWSAKYRGFDKGSLNRHLVMEAWDQGRNVEAQLTRFVGMGGALMLTDFRGNWRHWITTKRELNVYPSGKRVVGHDTCFKDHLCDTMAAWPVALGPSDMSYAYPLTWSNVPAQAQYQINLRTEEEEHADSYA